MLKIVFVLKTLLQFPISWIELSQLWLGKENYNLKLSVDMKLQLKWLEPLSQREKWNQ